MIVLLLLLCAVCASSASFSVSDSNSDEYALMEAVLYSCIDGNMAVCESDDFSALYDDCALRLFAPAYNISQYPDLKATYDTMFYQIAYDVYPTGQMMK